MTKFANQLRSFIEFYIPKTNRFIQFILKNSLIAKLFFKLVNGCCDMRY